MLESEKYPNICLALGYFPKNCSRSERDFFPGICAHAGEVISWEYNWHNPTICSELENRKFPNMCNVLDIRPETCIASECRVFPDICSGYPCADKQFCSPPEIHDFPNICSVIKGLPKYCTDSDIQYFPDICYYATVVRDGDVSIFYQDWKRPVCSNLELIKLPNICQFIGGKPKNCSSLECITFPNLCNASVVPCHQRFKILNATI